MCPRLHHLLDPITRQLQHHLELWKRHYPSPHHSETLILDCLKELLYMRVWSRSQNRCESMILDQTKDVRMSTRLLNGLKQLSERKTTQLEY